MQTKMQTNRGTLSQSLEIRGFAWCEKGDSNPLPPSNISDLTPKSMQTNADKALECRQNADKLKGENGRIN